MRPAERIKKIIKNAKVNIDVDVKKAALDELINELENTKKKSSAEIDASSSRSKYGKEATK